MKNYFSTFRNRSRGGIFYVKNNETGQRESLFTTDKNRASELLVAKNESVRERTHNAQKARIYALASDPKARTRTWGVALKSMIESKMEGSENRARLDRFSKEKSLQPRKWHNDDLCPQNESQVLRRPFDWDSKCPTHPATVGFMNLGCPTRLQTNPNGRIAPFGDCPSSVNLITDMNNSTVARGTTLPVAGWIHFSASAIGFTEELQADTAWELTSKFSTFSKAFYLDFWRRKLPLVVIPVSVNFSKIQ